MAGALAFVLCLALSSCASKSPTAKHEITGVILVVGGDAAVFTWDQNGRFNSVVPDTPKVVKQLDALSASTRECVGMLYDATFVVGAKKKPYRVTAGMVKHTPLLEIQNAHLTRRSEEQLHEWLHEADISASSICRSGADSRPSPMKDTYITGSRVMKSR
jgi:hypothetical protein